MNFDELHNVFVKTCSICKGEGVISHSSTEIEFCKCLKYYIFTIRMIERGVPMKYIFSYSEDNPDKKINMMFQNDMMAFNKYMTLSKEKNILLCDSVHMFTINDYSGLDGIMVFNLGLETFQNNSIVLYRLIKEVEDRGIYGIFSFAVKRENISNFYLDFIQKKINEYTTL